MHIRQGKSHTQATPSNFIIIIEVIYGKDKARPCPDVYTTIARYNHLIVIIGS